MQAITTNNEITEEQKLAYKHSGVLEGPGKLEDTDYDVLDLRPSELAIKVKEKRGAYAVPKDPGQARLCVRAHDCVCARAVQVHVCELSLVSERGASGVVMHRK